MERSAMRDGREYGNVNPGLRAANGVPPSGLRWTVIYTPRSGLGCLNRYPGSPCRTPPLKRNGQTASLSSLAARKATFLLALILIGSPVAGLRPMRAARLRT